MVDIEDLNISGNNNSQYSKEFDVSDNVLVDDDLRIRFLIDQHIQYTNSNLAKNIIDDWKNNLSSFKKIMPVDFKKVLIENENNNNHSKIVA